jgi:dTDP-4-amino-4,6-dideoxygalactose transaminase
VIPRLKPYLGWEEAGALFGGGSASVERFEAEFARTFDARHAIAFPYGRAALWAFFKAMGLEGVEVLQPAYSCVVVAHATVLSGNTPRFVDCNLHDYKMNLEQFASAMNEHTRVVIPTHLFGYPMDVDAVNEIIRTAEKRYGHKIWVVQDCAHSFGASWQGGLVCNAGDVALYGLNISKMITSIFGGMLTTNDDPLAEKIRGWRDAHFHKPAWVKSIRRRLYLMAVYPAFSESLYGFVYWLQNETPLLDVLTKAYHLDEKIHFPPDHMDLMLGVEAEVGRKQLEKYGEIVEKRRETAGYFNEVLSRSGMFDLPPLVDGATYSHYVIRVPDRNRFMREMARRGVQLGQLIEYSIPHMAAYENYAGVGQFPNSRLCSRQTINLPIHPGLDARRREKIARTLVDVAGSMRLER